MRISILNLFFWILASTIGYAQSHLEKITISNSLTLIPLTEKTYQHVSEMVIAEFGRFTCNGLIYINGNEALICDTPPTVEQSKELLSWLKKNHPDVSIKAVVVNHFHVDCLGGLSEFHKAGIKSYSHKLTSELLKVNKDTFDVPQIPFSSKLELPIGNKKIINHYLGEGHTKDNIVTWIPSENVLFGGCLVKAMDSGKGNLAHANVKEWSNTVARVKAEFPLAKIVVPGHGNNGGTELLDYTVKLFDADR
jgi:metallo-beta-lactamase class B